MQVGRNTHFLLAAENCASAEKHISVSYYIAQYAVQTLYVQRINATPWLVLPNITRSS